MARASKVNKLVRTALLLFAVAVSAATAPGQEVPLPPIGGAMEPANQKAEKLLLPPPRSQDNNPAPADEKTDRRHDKQDEREKDGSTLPLPRPVHSQTGYDLDGLVALMLQRNPSLAQAAYSIDAATGRAVQAGLYPNPVVSVVGDEIADRTGPVILGAGVSQEIITAGKLRLSRDAAEREIDQAALNLLSLRYNRLAAVRQTYFELLSLQRRIQILNDLYNLAEQSVRTSEKLLKAGQAARLDVVQLEVERERFRAEKEASLREVAGVFRRLSAAVGVTELPYAPLSGSIDLPLPTYDLEQAREFVSRVHPDILSAKQGIVRAQLLLERAKVEPIPNVNVQAGYVYQGQNRSNDFMVGASLPVPIWNRNQGNIAAAQAQLGEAIQQVGRTENELVERLAQSFELYSSAKRRAELYRQSILPRAQESYRLSLKGYQAGQSDYLRVLEAQRAYSQADLEYVRSQGEAWRAAAEISGLLLEEQWPASPLMLQLVPTKSVPTPRQ